MRLTMGRIPRIFASPTYRLDNNEVEAINATYPDRSPTDNRLTLRSRSRACTHRWPSTAQCGVNVFDYFCDITTDVRMAAKHPDRKIPRPASRPLETLTKIAAQNLDGFLFMAYLLSRTVVREKERTMFLSRYPTEIPERNCYSDRLSAV